MLTVLMPVSAVDEFLPIAVDSIQNQTFKDFVCHILLVCSGFEDLT